VTALEERLRAELRAESELITQAGLPGWQVPADAAAGAGVARGRWAVRGRWGSGRRRPVRWRDGMWGRWPVWVAPLLAAVAVAAVLAASLSLSLVLSGPPAPVTGPDPVGGVPVAYAYTVQGNIYQYVSGGTQYGSSVLNRWVKIRSTATGRLLATISPPAPYNELPLLTSDATGRTFVFGAERDWRSKASDQGPRWNQLNQHTPVKFLLVRVSASGHVRESALTLPEALQTIQSPTIALSPDGTKLAVAFGGGGYQPAEVQVISLTTGKHREWTESHVRWTPWLLGSGNWAADGRTLAVQQSGLFLAGDHDSVPARVSRTPVQLLDTAAPGRSLTAARLLRLAAPPGKSLPWQPQLTPDGQTLIATVGWPVHGLRRIQHGAFAVYSARTGALLHTMARWVWNPNKFPNHGGFPSPKVAWATPSGRQLIVVQPDRPFNRLGVLTGRRVQLGGGGLLPPTSSAGYEELQEAWRVASQVVW
jgi:hypothetical protein